MNKILYFITIVIFVASCSKISNRYTVNISFDNKNADSAYIYVYEEEYGALRLYDKGDIKNGKAIFSGEITEPKIAFLKFGNDTVPYYFILSNNRITISLNDNKYILKGGVGNSEYYRYLLCRQNIGNSKKYIWSKYEKYVNDSLLTDSIENVLKDYNNKLTDSLENITVDFIKANSLSSEIVSRQFGNSLPDSKIVLLKDK